VSPALADNGNLTSPTALVLFIKYPLPATIVVTVEPFDTTTDCQVTAGIEPDAPKAIDVPLTVTVEFASLALAIEPANMPLVTLVFGSVTVFDDTFKVDANLSAVIVPGDISAATTELSVSAFDPILSIAITLNLFYTIYT